jgi:hypothetical protein
MSKKQSHWTTREPFRHLWMLKRVKGVNQTRRAKKIATQILFTPFSEGIKGVYTSGRVGLF